MSAAAWLDGFWAYDGQERGRRQLEARRKMAAAWFGSGLVGGGEAEMGFDSLGSEFQLDQRRDAGLLRSMTSTVTGAWGSQDEAGKGERRLLGS
ncbi:hypothetical protein M0R45_001381 [Rubus argutus]|uniref:Uncharacterized protein n=1 Tax=Rubus argutus TaxID=59490 RepID=A0AAW1VKW0_RUBAR